MPRRSARRWQARFKPTDWEQVVKPLNDKLRGHQQQALTAYLLAQEPLIEWGVVDADSLFEFFLIDVQMCTCMETSRIKQAIRRCSNMSSAACSASKSRTCTPKCSIAADGSGCRSIASGRRTGRSSSIRRIGSRARLRDDKSPFYKELESELLQKDIDPDLIEAALRRFLYKVDEVANMQVIAIHVAGNVTSGTLHVFARTRATPHALYYRTYSFASADWTPWEKMPVDIPAYELTDAHGVVAKTGVYLVPVVWNNRLLVFFPDFLKKSAPNAQAQDKNFSDINDSKVSDTTQQNVYWEIKLAWSERREGKWTQKQISGDRAFHYWSTTFAPPDYVPAGTVLKHGSPVFVQLAAKSTDPSTYFTTDITSISQFVFVPRADASSVAVPPKDLNVDIYYCAPGSELSGSVLPRVARFTFSGNELHTDSADPPAQVSSGEIGMVMFQLIDAGASQVAYSLQAAPSGDPPVLRRCAGIQGHPGTALMNLSGSPATFVYGFTHDLLKAANTEDLDGLYQTFVRRWKYACASPRGVRRDRRRPHAVVQRAKTPVFFEQLGIRLPRADGDGGEDGQREAVRSRAGGLPLRLRSGLPGHLPAALLGVPAVQEDQSRSQPRADVPGAQAWSRQCGHHGLAGQPVRASLGRPRATGRLQMKWAVMRYIQLLVDYGDYYFRQNTLETVPMAIQCYVLASHLFGPRPQVIPKRGKIQPETYQSLLDRRGCLGNAIVELELIFPFSNQTDSAGRDEQWRGRSAEHFRIRHVAVFLHPVER